MLTTCDNITADSSKIILSVLLPVDKVSRSLVSIGKDEGWPM